MKLVDGIHLVGSGSYGFDLTDPFDCHVYLLDGGDELALVDAGAGLGAEAILDNVRRDGLDPARIRQLILTHAHGDHAGGAARLRSLLHEPIVYLSEARAEALRTADEQAISLGDAKRAGIYPPDYRFEACPVDVEIADSDEIPVGQLTLRVLETPGHADGHVSLLLERGGRRSLFAGDVVFHGGKILLQAIHDCRLDALIRSLRRLRDLEVDALFPGHLAFSLTDGQRHIERANQVLDRLLIPEQIVGAW
jgi:hydroxyacylglutathione hydrolase